MLFRFSGKYKHLLNMYLPLTDTQVCPPGFRFSRHRS